MIILIIQVTITQSNEKHLNPGKKHLFIFSFSILKIIKTFACFGKHVNTTMEMCLNTGATFAPFSQKYLQNCIELY